MKKFFKVVTVSTVGLLFTMTNDVVAAAARPTEYRFSELPLKYTCSAFPHAAAGRSFKYLQDPNIGYRLSEGLCSLKYTYSAFPHAAAGGSSPGYDASASAGCAASYAETPPSEEAIEGVLRGIQYIPDRLQILTIQDPIGGTPFPDTLLPALTNLKSLNLTWFTLSEETLAQLIAKIDGGLSHLKLMPWNDSDPLYLRLWQHIISLGSACDLESKADAHQRLWNEPRIPYATNPHASAILCLGLPEDNQYVVWAHERLARKHNKRTIPIRTESGFLALFKNEWVRKDLPYGSPGYPSVNMPSL